MSNEPDLSVAGSGDQTPPTVRSLIVRTLSESSATDPRDIAATVVTLIPADRIRALLEDALVADVRLVMGEQRNRAMSGVFASQRTQSSEQADEVSRRRSARSAKVTGIRDWWTEFKDARIYVGKVWTTVGECTEADLEFAELERRADAARELIRADQLLKLRKLLREHGVKTVAELPAEAVKELR